MATARQPVSIDGIEFDALITQTDSYSADVPTYPVEEGFAVSDTVILQPLELSMTLFVSNTPVTWLRRHGSSQTRVQDVLNRLRELYFSRKPVTVSTSERTYQSMAIVSIELSKNLETGTSREIPISFREIRVTESRKTTIPASYGRGGATGANAGTANVTNSATPGSGGAGSGGAGSGSSSGDGGTKSSILYGLANGAGLLGGLGL